MFLRVVEAPSSRHDTVELLQQSGGRRDEDRPHYYKNYTANLNTHGKLTELIQELLVTHHYHQVKDDEG